MVDEDEGGPEEGMGARGIEVPAGVVAKRPLGAGERRGARLAGKQTAVEGGHQDGRRRVVDRPEAGEDGGGASPLDIVQDHGVDAPGERLSRDELMKLVSQRMSDQERRIIYLKYWEELPMREIGDLTGLSESRVCKIHTRLIERLQDRFRAHEADTLV